MQHSASDGKEIRGAESEDLESEEKKMWKEWKHKEIPRPT